MKKIIFSRPDGGLSVIHPVINSNETLTEDEAIDRARKDIPPEAIDVQIVDESAIPSDRTFRNAWTVVAGAVEHDMAKCREIHTDKLRTLRKPLLERLDMEYLRADERGDAAGKVAIAAQKQALRDVTSDPAIAAARTPEDLKAVMPEALK